MKFGRGAEEGEEVRVCEEGVVAGSGEAGECDSRR